MKDTKFRILLDIHEVRSQVTIPVKVGDVSCKIYITLVEGGKPYKIHENSFGVFTGQKGDDNYLFNNCVIENGSIRYDFTPQTVAAAGILECEVRIYDEDGGVLTTPSFTIVVDERAVKDSDLASGTEFTFLDEIIVNEGQRMENERNRIEAFNNMELTVEDKGDNYLLTKTNKDGSKEEFPIGKGEDYEITPEDYQAIADKVVKDNLDSQAEEYFESLDARATEFLEDVKNQNKNYIDEATEVTATASGSTITIESANAPLQNLKLFGSTTQNGTPTPDAPKELTSVGDSGSFTVKIQGENYEEQTLIMPYTLRSVGDIKDEVDFARGVFIQRIKSRTFKGTENWYAQGSIGYFYSDEYLDYSKYFDNSNINNFKSNVGSIVPYKTIDSGGYGLTYASNYRIKFENMNAKNNTVDEFKAYLQANPITVIGILATPIETPLTETELNAYRQLMTNSGNTTILSEADMTLDYYTPKGQALGNIHSQVNKDYLKLQQAIIETGGN